jgi:CRP-like cAMP-binding protein
VIEVHLKKLRQRVDISAEEERAIRGLVSETRNVPADEVLVHAGDLLNVSLLLLKGWLARTKDLAGGERQIMELHVPGDFPDLHGFTLKRLDHDVLTLSPCRIGVVPHERVMELTDRYPRLARVYWLMTNIDAAIHREWTLSLGQRVAISRTAHLFCELYVRLELGGLTEGNSFPFPLNQRELSECLGLTTVHVNRTLQELRRRGLIELTRERLTIRDRGALEAVAEFDPAYLYLEKRPI